MKTIADVWNTDKHGDPEAMNVDPSITEYDGFKLGDRVVATADGDENNGEYFFSDDDGTVIGFAKFEAGLFYPEPRTEVVVEFDDMDPVGIMDAYDKLDNLSR